MTNLSDPLTPSLMQERSEFYLTLAQAFLTPLAHEHYQAMVHFLADDLTDLERSLTYGVQEHLDALRAALANSSGHEEFLIEYSRMFLQPPHEATLNVCHPLDGAMMGGTVAAIELFYRHYGVERGDHFKDLPDHVSVQLEFVSLLYGRAAQALESGSPDDESEKAANHFLHTFFRRWVPLFESAIEKAGRNLELKSNPYLPLMRILATAVARDAQANPDWVVPKKQVDLAMDKARQKYASKGITAEDMADIERKMREKGLSTDHLAVAMDKRNEAMGLTAKTPPDHRRR